MNGIAIAPEQAAAMRARRLSNGMKDEDEHGKTGWKGRDDATLTYKVAMHTLTPRVQHGVGLGLSSGSARKSQEGKVRSEINKATHSRSGR